MVTVAGGVCRGVRPAPRCHQYRQQAARGARQGRQVAFGNIFATDLATGLLFPLCAILAGHSMHPNEWALLIYDRAGADANFMVKEFLARNGFDMITRAKENMRFEVLAKRPFDKSDKFNAG